MILILFIKLYLMCQEFILKLYVSGDSLRTRRAIANLKEFCDRALSQLSSIEIIDVVKAPQIAESEKILITPTLVREFPLPQERIIGDLSNTDVLSFILKLPSQSDKKQQ